MKRLLLMFLIVLVIVPSLFAQEVITPFFNILTGRLKLGQSAAPTVTTNKLYNVGGSLYWNGVLVGGGGAAYWAKSGTDLSPLTAGDDILLNAGETLTISDLTLGSILFTGTGGLVSQDNTNLFWDNTNNRLSIGASTPHHTLDIETGGAEFGIVITNATTDSSYLAPDSTNLNNGALRINNLGYVGIGTYPDPNRRLLVNGDITCGSNNMLAGVYYDSNDLTYYVNPDAAGNASNLSAIFWGRVCLGKTSASAKLDVAGEGGSAKVAIFDGNKTTEDLISWTNKDDGSFGADSSGVINSKGDLEVNANILARDTLFVGGATPDSGFITIKPGGGDIDTLEIASDILAVKLGGQSVIVVEDTTWINGLKFENIGDNLYVNDSPLSGGLSKGGIIPASIISQGIYTAEGTNSSVTLYSSTGSQDRVMVLTQGVGGVGTIIGVQSGESLSGITDGTYTTQSDGELILFIDNDTGEWTVQVVGASQPGESLISNMDLTDITDTNTDLILGLDPSTGQTALHNDGTATITRIGDKAICTLRITTDDDDEIGIIFGTNIVPSGGEILSASINGFHRWDASSMTVSSSGNIITFDRATAIDADVSFELIFITDGWDELNQQVLAGMVQPVALHTASRAASMNSFTGTDDPIIFDTDYANTGSLITNTTTITIQQDGEYRISFDVSGDMTESTSADRYIYVVKNVADPTDDAAALAAAILADHSWASSSVVGVTQWSGEGVYSLVANDVLILYFAAANSGDRIRIAHMNVQQLPLSTVVNPGSFPVIDDDTFATATDANVPTSESVKAYVDDSNRNISHRTITASGNTTATDHYILCNHSSSMTLTIRTADILAGRIFHISDISGNAATNNITIATEGAETINGSATAVIDTDNGWFEILATSTTTLFVTSF